MTTPIPGQTEAPYFLDLLEVDFRAEILAAALANNADLGGRVIVNPTGLHNRSYSKDIDDLRFWYPTHSDQPYQCIDTPREGLFDMMPQYLFVEPRSPDAVKDTDQVLADMRIDRQLEEEARQFFRPFDVELNHLRTLAVHYDDAVDRLDDARVIIDQFALHWPILNRMNPTEAGLFLSMLPYIHQLRSDLHWFSRLLERFFNVPVYIGAGRSLRRPVRVDNRPALDNCRLGIDSVAGDRFDDGRNGVQIVLGPVPTTDIERFLPGSDTLSLLDELIAYFVPIATEVSVSVRTAPPLPDAPRPAVVYMGYSTYL